MLFRSPVISFPSHDIVVALTDKSALFVMKNLIERGLIYAEKDELRTPATLKEVLGNEITGLGPASLAKLKLKDLDDAPAAAKKGFGSYGLGAASWNSKRH